MHLDIASLCTVHLVKCVGRGWRRFSKQKSVNPDHGALQISDLIDCFVSVCVSVTVWSHRVVSIHCRGLICHCVYISSQFSYTHHRHYHPHRYRHRWDLCRTAGSRAWLLRAKFTSLTTTIRRQAGMIPDLQVFHSWLNSCWLYVVWQ